MSLYAAKCYWPGVTRADVEHAGAVARLNVDGARHLGSLVFPDDALVLCLFDAGAPGAVVEAAERTTIPYERVMAALWLGEGPAPSSRSTIGRSV